MKYLLAVLFSVLLLWAAQQNAPVKKSFADRPKPKRVVTVQTPDPTPAPQVQPVNQVVTPTPVQETEPAPVVQPTLPTVTSDDHGALMALAGISSSDYSYVDYIVTHESTWNLYATEPTTGAYGLCQSLPATKMASAGSDWRDNPVTQLIWCNSYAQSAYGGWAGAYAHWISNRWW